MHPMLGSFMSVCPLRALAQEGHSHTPTAQHHETEPPRSTQASALIKIVRDSTERFKDVSEAENERAIAFNSVA